MNVNALRKASGMSIKAFAEYLNIPYRTIQNWLSGKREAPPYLVELIEYKLRNEGLI